jgi:hypothetical protein
MGYRKPHPSGVPAVPESGQIAQTVLFNSTHKSVTVGGGELGAGLRHGAWQYLGSHNDAIWDLCRVVSQRYLDDFEGEVFRLTLARESVRAAKFLIAGEPAEHRGFGRIPGSAQMALRLSRSTRRSQIAPAIEC